MGEFEHIIKAMENDLERAKKEKDMETLDSMKSWYSGEINTLERYIEFIKATSEL